MLGILGGDGARGGDLVRAWGFMCLTDTIFWFVQFSGLALSMVQVLCCDKEGETEQHFTAFLLPPFHFLLHQL